jgi:hypothetical protein
VSCAVAALPSMSAFRIAVTGRQALHVFFAFQIAITASAIEALSSA